MVYLIIGVTVWFLTGALAARILCKSVKQAHIEKYGFEEPFTRNHSIIFWLTFSGFMGFFVVITLLLSTDTRIVLSVHK